MLLRRLMNLRTPRASAARSTLVGRAIDLGTPRASAARSTLAGLAIVLATLASCVDRGPGPQGKKIEPSYVRANLLTEAPADLQRLDIDVGGKVTFLGSKITVDGRQPATSVAPGGPVRVTSYWKVNQPLGRGFRLFRYARGAQGSADFQNFGPTDMELGHPLHTWKPGQIIQDEQEIVLRPDWRSPVATVFVGIVADKGHQLGDRLAAKGPHTVDSAIIAAQLQVDLSKAPPPAGTVHVPRATAAIVVDGAGTEAGWATAVTSPELVTADGSPDPVGKTIARMTWDDQFLYVFVQITDKDIFSSYKQHDDPIWKQDCVELFIDADGNRRGYIELQVNPNNTTFDSYFAGTRAQPGDETWDSGMQTAVKVRGTADKGGDADQGWDVEIAIPLAAVKGRDEAMNVRLPPQVGDKWRLNVVRVDYRSNGGNPAVASWNRIGYGDFHALDRMLTAIFADPKGSVTPATTPTPAPTPAPTPTPTPTPVPAPTPATPPTPTPTPTGTPAPTGASTPTGTPAPARTSTPAPARTPTPAPARTPTSATTPTPTGASAPTPTPKRTPTPAPTPKRTPAPAPAPAAPTGASATP